MDPEGSVDTILRRGSAESNTICRQEIICHSKCLNGTYKLWETTLYHGCDGTPDYFKREENHILSHLQV